MFDCARLEVRHWPAPEWRLIVLHQGETTIFAESEEITFRDISVPDGSAIRNWRSALVLGVTFGLTIGVNLTIGILAGCLAAICSSQERERQRVALQRLTWVNEASRSGVTI